MSMNVLNDESLPPAGVPVLCHGGSAASCCDGWAVGYWVKRHDLPDGRYWCINGQSGGIGTVAEVSPPKYWMHLPEVPAGRQKIRRRAQKIRAEMSDEELQKRLRETSLSPAGFPGLFAVKEK